MRGLIRIGACLALAALSACAAKPVHLGPLPPAIAGLTQSGEFAGNPCAQGEPVLVNYVTDRQPVAPGKGKDESNQRFSADRNYAPQGAPHQPDGMKPPADLMTLGHALVCFPEKHEIGQSKQVKVGLVARPVVEISERQPSNRPYPWVESLATQAKAGDGHVLIYVHGFNNSFEQSMLRAARLKKDIGFRGPVIAFAWPSSASIFIFSKDMVNARFSEVHFNHLLSLLPADGSDVAIVAHSLGNEVISASLATLNPGSPVSSRIREVIMAAPALDGEFLRLNVGPAMVSALPKARITIYASRHDLAMDSVKFLKTGYANAGDARTLFTMPKAQTIDATNASVGVTGHAYFVDSAAVLRDIAAIVCKHATPTEASRHLNPVADYPTVWEFAEAATGAGDGQATVCAPPN